MDTDISDNSLNKSNSDSDNYLSNIYPDSNMASSAYTTYSLDYVNFDDYIVPEAYGEFEYPTSMHSNITPTSNHT